MGKTEKKLKENHATNVTKIPKTKRQEYLFFYSPALKFCDLLRIFELYESGYFLS